MLSLFWLFALAAGAVQEPRSVSIHAPYVTTPPRVIEEMLRLAGMHAGDVIYDLGCGDGRIVIAAARKYGVHGVGIDINPDRIRQARANAGRAGVSHLVEFREQDILEADIHDATVVTLYLLPALNLELRPRLLTDLKPGARVVSHCFHMGNWKPARQTDLPGCSIYFWTIP